MTRTLLLLLNPVTTAFLLHVDDGVSRCTRPVSAKRSRSLVLLQMCRYGHMITTINTAKYVKYRNGNDFEHALTSSIHSKP